MKLKKTSVILLAVLTVFATLLCLYSNKLSSESISASRIISGQFEAVTTGEYSSEDCNKDDCTDDNCTDDDCSDKKEIDPNFSQHPKRGKNSFPRIGKRKPRPDMPRLPNPAN